MDELGAESVILVEDWSCSKQDSSIKKGIFIARYSVKASIHKAQWSKKMHEKQKDDSSLPGPWS